MNRDEAFEKWFKEYEKLIVGYPNETSKMASFLTNDAWNAAWDTALLKAAKAQCDWCNAGRIPVRNADGVYCHRDQSGDDLICAANPEHRLRSQAGK
jgi:hypothetical protein